MNTAEQSCDFASFSSGGESIFQIKSSGFEIKFLGCMLFSLKTPVHLKVYHWTHQQLFVGTSVTVIPFSFRFRELQMCIVHISQRLNRFVRLLCL